MPQPPLAASRRIRGLMQSAAAAAALAELLLLAHSPVAAQSANPISTVFVIVFENTDWSQIAGSSAAPYINSLLPQASHASQYFTPPGVHPSTPNYWWMEAGQDFGLAGLSNYTPQQYPQTTPNHLVDYLESAGITWKTYEENIDGTTCPLSDVTGYTVHHNPFIFFTDVTNNNDTNAPRCIAHVRPYTELATDLAQGTVPRYNFIVPNLCDDMHDCGIAAGDTWLANNLPAILNSTAYLNGGAVFITWDEGANAASDGPVGMIVMSPVAKGKGYSNSIYYTHSSLLLTLQEIFGVGPLLGDAPNATDLSDLFASFPSVTPSTPTPANASTGVSTTVTLGWSSSGGNDSLRLGTSNPPPAVAVATAITNRSYTPTVLPNTTYYWQVVSTTAAGTTAGPVWQFTTGTTSLPAGWANEDVGAVVIAGSSSYTGGTFTVKGAGADIWGTADAFQYAYQTVTGDFQVVARVKSLQNTSVYAKAGLMIRDTLLASSDHVILDVKPAGGVEFMQRATSGGTTSYLGGTTLAFPNAWLRLTRSGSTVTAAASADGATWTTIGSTNTTFPAQVFVGLPVCSHTVSALTTAAFDSVNIILSTSPPSTPSSPNPSSGATGVGTTPTLSWTATAATDYDVAFGTTNPPPSAATALTSAAYKPGTLVNGTTYYWQVTASNLNGATAGPVWSFTTAAVVAPGTPSTPNPANGATGIATNATLTWSDTGATSYDVAFGTSNPPATAATGLTTTSYAPPGMTAGTTYFWQIVAHNAGGSTSGSIWSFATAPAAPPPTSSSLPSPWLNRDIGSVGLAGSASYSNPAFTVKGAGSDIWGSSDSFQFVYQAWTGDVQIVARVTGELNTNQYAKAGLMLRETLTNGSRDIILDVKPLGGVEFMTRASTGGSTTFIAGATQVFPAWLKLVRSGSTVTGYVSADGLAWTIVGSTTTAMASNAFVGLAVCSHNTSALNTATFDSVTVQ